jgi:alpha-1,3-glucan synthase
MDEKLKLRLTGAPLLTITGIAFFLVGLPSFHGVFQAQQSYIQAAATWSYAIASAAGFLFFGMNFGEEAGATTQSWIFRACVVQGLQQCWTAALWYWGSLLTAKDPDEYSAFVFSCSARPSDPD